MPGSKLEKKLQGLVVDHIRITEIARNETSVGFQCLLFGIMKIHQVWQNFSL